MPIPIPVVKSVFFALSHKACYIWKVATIRSNNGIEARGHKPFERCDGLILVEWNVRLGVTPADGCQGGIRTGFIPYFLERQKQWKEFTVSRLFLIKR